MTTVRMILRSLAVSGCVLALGAPPAMAARPTAEDGVARKVDRLGEQLRAQLAECWRLDLAGLWGDGGRVVAAPIRKLEAALVDLLEQHPNDTRIAAQLHELYGDVCAAPESPSLALLNLLEAAADPVRLTMRLAEGRGTPAATKLVLAGLALRPGSVALWMEAARRGWRQDWKIALTARGVRVLLGEGGVPPGAEQRRLAAAVAEEELVLELEVGLLERATRQLALLPEEVRAIVESGATGPVEAEIGGVNVHGQLLDLRLDLALLRLAQGDAAGAASFLAGARTDPPPSAASATAGGGERQPPSRDERVARQEALSTWAWYRVLQTWREPSPEDPYQILVSGLSAMYSYGRRIGLAAIARRERYPALATYLERPLADDLRQRLAGPAFGDAPGYAPSLPAPADAEIAALRDEIAALAGQLDKRASLSAEEARAALGPDVAAAAVARQLRAPRLEPFTEHPLPRGVPPLGHREMDRRRRRAMRQLKLPAGFSDPSDVLEALVRVERQGDRAVAIGRSIHYGGSAYWVILSADGGATWSRPLYTGLFEGQPYVVRAASKLPLLAGDRLQIEVEVPEPASSPPGPHPRPPATGIYLEVPIAALERDSDGDGLTDLAEERLLTDPLDPDTDHDGIPDGQDPVPQVAAAAPDAAPAASRALAALVEKVYAEEGRRVTRGEARYGGDETEYWVGERRLFAALQPPHRTVVLTPEEMGLAEEKFGWCLHYTLELFLLDRAGHRAYGIWSYEPNYGGVIVLEDVGGRWQAEEVGSWIS